MRTDGAMFLHWRRNTSKDYERFRPVVLQGASDMAPGRVMTVMLPTTISLQDLTTRQRGIEWVNRTKHRALNKHFFVLCLACPELGHPREMWRPWLDDDAWLIPCLYRRHDIKMCALWFSTLAYRALARQGFWCNRVWSYNIARGHYSFKEETAAPKQSRLHSDKRQGFFPFLRLISFASVLCLVEFTMRPTSCFPLLTPMYKLLYTGTSVRQNSAATQLPDGYLHHTLYITKKQPPYFCLSVSVSF